MLVRFWTCYSMQLLHMAYHRVLEGIMELKMFLLQLSWRRSAEQDVAHISGAGLYFVSYQVSCLTFFIRSVHNTRIERLWADVTIGVGSTWRQLLTMLEIHHGMDIDNLNHVWLIQHLFLSTINSQLDFWAQSWNQHSISI